eukprot:IDg13967t1
MLLVIKLAGAPLKATRRATYLKISLTPHGIDGTCFREFIKAAKRKLSQLLTIGLNARRLCHLVNRGLYKTFVRSITEYGVYLTNFSSRANRIPRPRTQPIPANARILCQGSTNRQKFTEYRITPARRRRLRDKLLVHLAEEERP